MADKSVLNILMSQRKAGKKDNQVDHAIIELVNDYLPSDSLIDPAVSMSVKEIWELINGLDNTTKTKILNTVIRIDDEGTEVRLLKLKITGIVITVGLMVFAYLYETGNAKEMVEVLLPLIKELVVLLGE